MVQSTISNIRLYLGTYNKLSESGAKNVAECITLLRDDYMIMKQHYTKGVTGGYPISVGMVTKSHETDGEITVETHLSFY